MNKNKYNKIKRLKNKYEMTEEEVSSYTGITIPLLRTARARGIIKWSDKNSPAYGIDVYGLPWRSNPSKYEGVRYIGISEYHYRLVYKLET